MWVSGRAGEPPTPEQLERWHRRMSPPKNELPAALGIMVVLGRTGDAAVAVTHVEAFSTGFQFTLVVRLRKPRPRHLHGGLFMLVGSHGHPGLEIPLEDRLLLGLEYADGQRASTLQDPRMLGPGGTPDDEELTLVQHGGGGGDEGVEQTYWVSPLPPDGPVAFVLSWPSFGMPEARTVVDGAAIRAAAGQSQQLWPPQPLMPPPEPPSPPRPATGWFADPPD